MDMFGNSSSGSKGSDPFSIPDVGNIDIGKLSRPPKGGAGPDYIPYSPRGRDSFARVSFNTGVAWLSGFLGGGAYGFAEGWRNASSPNYKIKMNSILNASSKRGSNAGNALGILVFMHTASVALLDLAEAEKYIDHYLTVPVLSGVITGGLYKSTKGPRAAALAAVIGAGASCTYFVGGSVVNKVLGRGGKF
ncbi:hypothetical protein B484DRAFT_449594 [Ochromonadaceae sp. CCMP2298]|nr:hypothetical protein B484DRAFT_449594 [Ochromonadaceae sp. CCMP2298]|mmetsp:Transcript_8966/g.19760  ORF Transcript_8966/g.19760 Transcript_8966/m.19760 type:complete len:192 (-) Transcript_8966:529-1104(-)|eukprot:CAMPEP_0173204602 /NCGR_PEP_ID=MMETSP1141-20130122/20221_1 /TAXON_ID=483371 /ORGANISM="non described non described, Strain CCMP2298" /LENGTH=191 /DNA_ID=CAMNT_0014130299 /DNA_START=125 /DNA_END=700 /DNA_ORIENTATION=+